MNIHTLAFWALLLSSVAPMMAGATDNKFVIYPAQDIALVDVVLIDGTGSAPQWDVTILLKNQQIEQILQKHQTIPDGYKIIPLPGHTIIPGLVMLHEHLFYPTGLGNYTDMVHSFPSLYLAGGATTIRTAGTMAPYADLNISNATRLNTGFQRASPLTNSICTYARKKCSAS